MKSHVTWVSRDEWRDKLDGCLLKGIPDPVESISNKFHTGTPSPAQVKELSSVVVGILPQVYFDTVVQILRFQARVKEELP